MQLLIDGAAGAENAFPCREDFLSLGPAAAQMLFRHN